MVLFEGIWMQALLFSVGLQPLTGVYEFQKSRIGQRSKITV